MTNKLADKLWLPEDCGSVLCALSGGADSVCMLHALLPYCKSRGIKVCGAHFNHRIRGEEADRDAAFARSLCEKLNIPYRIGEGDVPAYAAEKHLSTEEAAREMRYAFLDAAAMVLGCRYIATAHNADDNAETILFNLTRGSGSKGLSGIPRRRGNIIRPMLDITRAEIEEYLSENSLEHVEDSSNATDDYARNLIRHRVMPILKEINPQFSVAAERTAALLRQDEEYLSLQAEMYADEFYDGRSIPAELLRNTHPAIASRLIRTVLGRELASVHVQAVLELAKGDGLGYTDIPGLRIRREQGRIFFVKEEASCIADTLLEPGKTVELPSAGLRISAEEGYFAGFINDTLTTYYLRYEKICWPLYITCRKSGDSFSPSGRGCTKTLKKLFTEQKYTQQQRNNTPVIRDAAGIALVAGFGKDRRFDCRDGDRVIKIEIINI